MSHADQAWTLEVAAAGRSILPLARVERIARDPSREDHFYAFVSDYLEFDHPVPFTESDFYYENGLRRDDGRTNKGAFGRAVRSISDGEYDLILKAGFVRTLLESSASVSPGSNAALGLEDEAR